MCFKITSKITDCYDIHKLYASHLNKILEINVFDTIFFLNPLNIFLEFTKIPIESIFFKEKNKKTKRGFIKSLQNTWMGSFDKNLSQSIPSELR